VFSHVDFLQRKLMKASEQSDLSSGSPSQATMQV